MVMKMHKLLWNILFYNQKNDFKMLFGFSSSFLDFQYTKIFVGKLWQPWKFRSFAATSTLFSYELVYYKKEYI